MTYDGIVNRFGEINALLDRKHMVTMLCVLAHGTAWYSVASDIPYDSDFMRDRQEPLVLQVNEGEPDNAFYRLYVLMMTHLTRSVLGLSDVFHVYGSQPPARNVRCYPDAAFNNSPDYVPCSSCSEIILSQLEHSVRHRRGSHGDECEAGKHLPEREAAAEAVGELGKVARQMLGAEVVVRAMKGALDVAQNRVDPSERGMLGALRSTSGHERLVNAPCLLHGAEAAQGVGHHDGAGLQVAPGPGRDLLAAKPTDTAQAHPHRPALIIELHGGHERRLARRASPRFAAAALPAPVRIIELHPAAQRARVVTLLHHLHQLVLDLPGGVVAHRQLPRQLQRRNPVLRLRHQVHRQEPGAKRQLRVGQDRARGQRVLVPAPAALIQRPALMAPVPGVLASGANEPVRPTPTKQRLCALLLAPVLVHELRQAVALLKLNPIACHRRLPIFKLLGTIRADWLTG